MSVWQTTPKEEGKPELALIGNQARMKTRRARSTLDIKKTLEEIKKNPSVKGKYLYYYC